MSQSVTKDLSQGTGQQLYRRAKTLIPGATQLYGKRQEKFAPEQWPTYFAEAQGVEVVDLDGQCYIDMCTCGIGATVLGYADPDVTRAIVERIGKGVMCMLNPPDEVELAELLLQIHPWAKKVRFGRMGGETMAIAIRIARARTRRDKIAFCGYHGWHDWYLSANLSDDGKQMVDRLGNWHNQPGLKPGGVPRVMGGTAIPFSYNKIDELKAIVERHGSELAAIVLETTRDMTPEPGFLAGVRDLAKQCGAVLIFDEISIAFKLCFGGAHLKYGVEPDLAVFSKTLGNGHPIAAVIGTEDVMDAAQDTFISSALWTEAVGPAAGVATLKKLMRIDVPEHLEHIGGRVREGLRELAQRHEVPLSFTGHHAMQYFHFDHPQTAALQTLWTVRMLRHGFLVSDGFYAMWAHQDQHVDAYLAACDPVFEELGQALKSGDVEQRIGGPVRQSGPARG